MLQKIGNVICISLSVYVYNYIYISVYLSTSVYQSVFNYMSVCLSFDIYPSVCICISINLSLYLFSYTLVPLPIRYLKCWRHVPMPTTRAPLRTLPPLVMPFTEGPVSQRSQCQRQWQFEEVVPVCRTFRSETTVC